MATFSDDLHELCKREMQEAIACRDTAAAMTTELVGQLANTIALVTCGNKTASREAVQHAIKALPQMVFEKSALVRAELQAMQREQSA